MRSWQDVRKTIVEQGGGTVATILLILGIILIIAGVFAIVRSQVIWGVVLIVIGLVIAPGSQLL